ncbi:hypothetical protein LWI29_011933 [Acer saccharum]|uniref:Armadillo-like repeats domain-containing protein n=1 Tax=Acer saccharum TaxID=4024 RepID=A0AA39RH11_ACESA|nr:hypothetical protein LWI29_011933 [Acer saccharum]
MALLAASSSSSTLQFLPRLPIPKLPFSSPPRTLNPYSRRPRQFSSLVVSAKNDKKPPITKEAAKTNKTEEVEVEVEEELPWIQEKALDLVEFTGSVTQALPGPRVGQSKPLDSRRPSRLSRRHFRCRFHQDRQEVQFPQVQAQEVNKNAMLCKAIDELFQRGKDAVEPSALKELVEKTGFSMEDVLRKYIRYTLNEKPFNPELVVNLIQLRKATTLEHTQVAEILNDISRRIVREKGPVVLNISGYSERGFKRKLAVQALFGKVFYLSELTEFCSRDSSLIVKEIFGVTDEDADKLRLHTLSEAGDMDSLEKMINDSDSEDAGENVVEGSPDEEVLQ